MRKELLKSIAIGLLISASTNVFAEDVWLRAHPSSYNIFVDQQIGARSDFEFKMYNPTNEKKTFNYNAILCAEHFENTCSIARKSKVVDPKTWWTDKFSLNTLVHYKYPNTYSLKARIEADGMEHVEHERHGQIIVYQNK